MTRLNTPSRTTLLRWCNMKRRRGEHEGINIERTTEFYTSNYLLQKVKHVLIGYRYATTSLNLIYFDNPQPFPSVANHSALALSTPSPSPSNIYAYSVNKMTTKNDLVLYLHQAEWRPVPSTLIKAIYACFYAIWIGLTSALALKHIPKTIYTSKGHLRQEQKNLLSKQ